MQYRISLKTRSTKGQHTITGAAATPLQPGMPEVILDVGQRAPGRYLVGARIYDDVLAAVFAAIGAARADFCEGDTFTFTSPDYGSSLCLLLSDGSLQRLDVTEDIRVAASAAATNAAVPASSPVPITTPALALAAPAKSSGTRPNASRKNLSKLPTPLLEAYRENNLALFLGSGLSLSGDVQGKFPTWSQLPERLLEACERWDALDEKAIKAKRKGFKVRMSLEQMLSELGTLRTALGRDYQAALNAIFRPSDAAPGAAHKAVAALGVKAILTTNYDQLMEKVLETPARQPYPWTEAAHALGDLKAGHKVLLKVHGTAERHETVVLSEIEYHRAHSDASYQAVLRYLLQDHVFLFVGYGMNDPLDLDLAFKGNAGAFKTATQRHYLLLRNPTDTDRDRYDREYNVRVIPYAKHAEVQEILARLATVKAGGAESESEARTSVLTEELEVVRVAKDHVAVKQSTEPERKLPSVTSGLVGQINAPDGKVVVIGTNKGPINL